MLWIGLTGGMGCGKSTALKVLKELNCGTESADAIVSELYKSSAVLGEISEALEITLDQDLVSMKSKISKKVFQDSQCLKALEAILHPKVREKALESKKHLESEGHKISFYEIPLLFEKNMEAKFDKTVCVGAKPSIQIERIKNRNPKWSEEEIQNRLASQMSLEEKKQRADFYIDNSGDLSDLKKNCEKLLSSLTSS